MRIWCALGAVAVLAGCMPEPPADTPPPAPAPVVDFARSGFAAVNADQEIARSLRSDVSSSVVGDDEAGAGYAFKLGLDGRDNFTAFAGLVRAGQIDPPRFRGTAKYQGVTTLRLIDRIRPDAPFAVSDALQSGMVLRVDLSDNRFTGRTPPISSSTRWQLTYSGDIEDGRLTGTSRLVREPSARHGRFDVTGKLRGRIGDNQAIAAFHGNDDEDIFAGGFRATR